MTILFVEICVLKCYNVSMNQTETLITPEILKLLKTVKNKTNELYINKGNRVFIIFDNYFIHVNLKEELLNDLNISDIKNLLKFAYRNKSNHIYHKKQNNINIFYSDSNNNKLEIQDVENHYSFNAIDIRDDIKQLAADHTLLKLRMPYNKMFEIYETLKRLGCLKNIMIKAVKGQKCVIIKGFNRKFEYEKIIKLNNRIKESFNYNFYLGKSNFYIIENEPIYITFIKSKISSKIGYAKIIQKNNIQFISSKMNT